MPFPLASAAASYRGYAALLVASVLLYPPVLHAQVDEAHVPVAPSAPANAEPGTTTAPVRTGPPTPPVTAAEEPVAPATTEAPGFDVAPPRAPALPEVRVLTQLAPERVYRRTWTRSVARTTSVERRQRRTQINDNTLDQLVVDLRYLPNESVYHVRVIRARTSPETGSSDAVPEPLPRANTELRCQQFATGALECVDATQGTLTPWPSWAVLDLNPWMTSAPVTSNARWRRSIADATLVGWPHDDSEAVRASFSMDTVTSNPSAATTFTGSAASNGHLAIHGEDVSYDITGTLNGTFLPDETLLTHFEIVLHTHIDHEAILHGSPLRWIRDDESRLTIRTELR